MDTHAGNDSPPLRSTILGSLLRGRPRNVSQSEPRELSPPPQNPRRPPRTSISNPTSPNPNTAISVAIPQPGSSTNFVPLAPSSPSAFASMLRRKPNPTPATNTAHEQQPAATTTTTSPVLPFTSPHTPQLATSLPSVIAAPSTMPSMPGALPMHSSLIPQPPPAAYNTFRIRLVPHLDSRRSLRFDAITRDLRETDPALRIGRFTDRSGMGLAAVNALGTNKLAFKSKVVSRAHAEIWVEKAGKFFIKDTKSSSGTFLNHIRLSPANQESRPHQLKDGDILQLGVDYQGGAEDIYKSVKIRVEVGREWQAGANAFNTAALKNLKNLAAVVGPNVQAALPTVANGKVATRSSKLQIPDCCICLFSVTIRQALFIAPCSHAFHFKCIRPLIEAHHPAFSCPLCRTYADLEEDVEVDSAELEADAEVGADADIEIDEASSGAQHKESDANAARTPLQQLQREDAEMSDGSSAPHVPPSLSSVPVAPAAIGIIAAPTGRLRPISENALHPCSDRDREAGGETEVEPDSVPSLSSFLAARRARGGTGGRMRHTSPELCTEEDEGLPGMVTGVEEADEVEMGDALEYNEPEEDSAMDEEHDREPAGIPMAVVAIDELGVVVGSAAAGTVSGGSISGKRKR